MTTKSKGGIILPGGPVATIPAPKIALPGVSMPPGQPNVIWTPYPKQRIALSCPIGDVLYGGAVGGGKSEVLLADWVKHAATYGQHARGLLVRRTLPELSDIISRANEKFTPLGATWLKTERLWTFPNGATLRLNYLENDEDATRYQGKEFTWLGVDECGAFKNPEPIDYIRSRMRSTAGVKRRVLLTANPGGRGHKWLFDRYVKDRRPYVPFRAENEPGRKLRFDRVYIPSTLFDNPALAADKTYVDSILASGPRWLVRALLLGDWNLRTDRGVYRRNWWKEFSALPNEQLMHIAISWDTAFGKDEQKGDRSAACVFAVFPSGYYLVDVWTGRVDFPTLQQQAVDLAAKWQCYDIMIEDKASGPSLIQQLKRDTLLALTPIAADRDKLTRAYATSPLVSSGRVYIPCANYKGSEEERKRFPIDSKWRADFLDETAAFPDSPHDDMVDAFSQGLAALSALYVVGLQNVKPFTMADLHKLINEDDDDDDYY